MALGSRRRRASASAGMEAWPGYVDALSTLLMVIIFVLLVFVLAQGFLSFALTGRNKALDTLNAKLADVGRMLSLEKSHAAGLEGTVSRLTSELATANADRQGLSARVADLGQQMIELNNARTMLTGQLGTARQNAQSAEAHATDLATRLADAQQHLEAMQRESEALNRTVNADRETIQAKLDDLARMDQQVRALAALRDQLEKQAQDAAARATTEADRRRAVASQLDEERKLGDSAKAQIVLLNQQVDQLKAQLGAVARALDVAQTAGHDKDIKIANLGQQLNAALAAKVQELQGYRSDFFGTLRKVLAGEPGIGIVGDRFVMQSDILFPVGSADLTPDGVVQMSKIAETVKHIAEKIPPNIAWVLDVDGYADSQPITGGPFASNWDLSASRAISVVNLLIREGVPSDHLAATGFGDNHPLDPSETPEGYAKNRRIELRLTDYNRTRT
jgi:chemotaxis protein MotB